jgi:hypothetical protein
VQRSGKPVSTGHLVEKYFQNKSGNSVVFEKIMSDMLASDPRFIADGNSCWWTVAQPERSLDSARFLFMDLEYLALSHRVRIPLIIGILEWSAGKITRSMCFRLNHPEFKDPDIRSAAAELIDRHGAVEPLSKNLQTIAELIQGAIVIPVSGEAAIARTLGAEFGDEIEYDAISLAQFTLDNKKRSVEQLSNYFGLVYRTPENLSARLELSADIVTHAVEMLAECGITTLDAFQKLRERDEPENVYSKFGFDRQFIDNIPEAPGIYLMRDKRSSIFYVGKSRNLNARIRSYFMRISEDDLKLKKIHLMLYDLSYELTGSELDALLLEHRYIKEYKPGVNTQTEIHGTERPESNDSRLILFVPAVSADAVTLFFVDGHRRASRLELDLTAPDETECERRLLNMFFEATASENDFSSEEMEIICRWIDRNRERVNCINVEETAGLSDCMKRIKAYLGDEELMSQKMTFI